MRIVERSNLRDTDISQGLPFHLINVIYQTVKGTCKLDTDGYAETKQECFTWQDRARIFVLLL